MRTLQSVVALGAMTGILCISTAAIAADEVAQPQQSQPAAMNALRVVRDAATGELRALTSEELKALLASQEAASCTSALSRSATATAPQILPVQKSVVRHSNDMMSMQLPQESLSGSASEVVRASLRLLEEHGQTIGTLRQALIDGEKSGDAGELDMQQIKSKARHRAGSHS